MGIRDIVSTLSNVPTLLKLKKAMKPRPLTDRDSLGARLEHNAQHFGDRPAILCEGRTVTWGELNGEANQLARALEAEGVQAGDTVSIIMENRIEFLATVFALNKLGAIGALINTNLIGRPLTHCIETTQSKKCIVGAERQDAVADVLGDLSLQEGQDFLFMADTGPTNCPNWARDLNGLSETQDAGNVATTGAQTLGNNALYIFTSGTTGLPKAAVLSNRRYLGSGALAQIAGLRCTEQDRIYLCLPLYHGTGLIIGVGAALHSGASMFVRRRFSASNFLSDVRDHHCTALIYIGELCRYLCNTPSTGGNDADNPLRAAMGNGLRPDIWHEFKNRYGIERISEFYGSSEGNVSFANLMNKDQTMGMTANSIALVRYDVDAEEIVRDANGRAIEVEAGEPGLLLGEITPQSTFEGYTDQAATEKKIVRNLRKDGDAWFDTGDLIREIDVGFNLGYPHYQFVDRLGDTFRWKSENVSTNEVGEIINSHPQVQFSNVYGVEVPKADGRAGMAALALNIGVEALDLADFSRYVQAELPAYAVPVFLRVQQEVDVTGTFKMVKGDLRKSGYDLAQVTDPLYVMMPGAERYEPLTAALAERIASGDARF
jgi:citronellyl-CoA synthetase